jgi:hypothetical protein
MTKINPDQFGLPQSTFDALLNTFTTFPDINWVKLYGSRALGTYQKGSDIDIAYSGPVTINAALLAQLEELSTPYCFDVTHYNSITEQGFKTHIDTHGIVIYP